MCLHEHIARLNLTELLMNSVKVIWSHLRQQSPCHSAYLSMDATDTTCKRLTSAPHCVPELVTCDFLQVQVKSQVFMLESKSSRSSIRGKSKTSLLCPVVIRSLLSSAACHPVYVMMTIWKQCRPCERGCSVWWTCRELSAESAAPLGFRELYSEIQHIVRSSGPQLYRSSSLSLLF